MKRRAVGGGLGLLCACAVACASSAADWTCPAFDAFLDVRAGSGGKEVPSSGDDSGASATKHKALLSPLMRLFSNSSDEDDRFQSAQSPPKDRKAVWHIRGRLSNPFTGETIAKLEGVELSRCISRKYKGLSPTSRREDHIAVDGLEVADAIQSGSWQAYGVTLCHKFYSWLDPHDEKNLLEKYRATPVSKSRGVPALQASSQAITYILRPSVEGLAAWTEWGDGRYLHANSSSDSGVEYVGSEFEKGVGSRGLLHRLRRSGARVLPKRVFNLSFFVKKEIDTNQRVSNNKWVAFGPTPPPQYGCKESYTYLEGSSGQALEGHGGVMSYHRYSECPSWYMPGRMCSLDVQATRVSDFEKLPSLLRQRVLSTIPTFEDLASSVREFKDASAAFNPLPARASREPWWQVWKHV